MNHLATSKEQTEISKVREQLELAKGPEYIEGNGSMQI